MRTHAFTLLEQSGRNLAYGLHVTRRVYYPHMGAVMGAVCQTNINISVNGRTHIPLKLLPVDFAIVLHIPLSYVVGPIASSQAAMSALGCINQPIQLFSLSNHSSCCM